MCDVQLTLDEWHADAESTAKGYYHSLQKLDRWAGEYGMAPLVANSIDELAAMHPDHRRVGWYFIDQTRRWKWGTMKKIRSALFNKYERLPGMTEADMPTSTVQFTWRMDGLLQRLGDVSEQARVMRKTLVKDLILLLHSDFDRARGERRVEMAQVNLAVHAYTQAGFRANEIFGQTVGEMKAGIHVGDKDVMDHLVFSGMNQTKENRFSKTAVPCAWKALHAPLRTGEWVLRALAERARVSRQEDSDFLFADVQGKQWTMTWLWKEHVMPALVRLKSEGLGGLTNQDLSKYGSNSFRRTWTTMAQAGPEVVTPDLMDRQARWGHKKRTTLKMSSLYADPVMNEILKATWWL